MLELIGYAVALAFGVGVGATGMSLLVTADSTSLRERVHDTANVPPRALVLGGYVLLVLAFWIGVHALRSLMAWL